MTETPNHRPQIFQTQTKEVAMWIFDKRAGFISVVQYRDDPEKLMVRARTRGDLERLVTSIVDDPGVAVIEKAEDLPIVETPDGDYRWRVTVPRWIMSWWAEQTVEQIDYFNVKDSIDQGDPERHAALMGVWSSMMRLQEPRSLGTLSKTAVPLTDDEWVSYAKGAGFDPGLASIHDRDGEISVDKDGDLSWSLKDGGTAYIEDFELFDMLQTGDIAERVENARKILAALEALEAGHGDV